MGGCIYDFVADAKARFLYPACFSRSLFGLKRSKNQADVQLMRLAVPSRFAERPSIAEIGV